MSGSARDGSIRRRIMLPLVIVTVIQAGLFYATTLFGGVTKQLRENSLDIFNERASSRAADLQNEMLQRWSNIDTAAEELTRLFRGAEASDSGRRQFLSDASARLVELLRGNNSSGAFIVLDGASGGQYDGVYIRDSDPDYSAPDNTDLLMEVCTARIARELNLPMDAWWRERFSLSPDESNDAFYFKPLQAAKEHPGLSLRDLGYWNPSFRVSQLDEQALTYSVPLTDEQGFPFGVFGVEISLEMLGRLMPASEISSESPGAYLLAVQPPNSGEYHNVAATGPLYRRLFPETETTRLVNTKIYPGVYEVSGSIEGDNSVYGSVHKLNLYNTNAPFSGEVWTLIGLMRRRDLLRMADKVNSLVILSTGLSMAIGAVSAVVVSAVISRPVKDLVNQLRGSDPREPVRLRKTNITEIDELSGAIAALSKDVADNATKLIRIIDLSGLTLGAFEHILSGDEIVCMGRIFEWFGLKNGENRMTAPELRSLLRRSGVKKENASPDGTEVVLKYHKDMDTQWIRLKLIREQGREIGVMVDVTRDVMVQRRLEFERDYDVLTNLFNRRAFFEQIHAIPLDKLGIAAMVMLDLDNLKYVNDTYGHDYGDAYIRTAAVVMKRQVPKHTLTARISGDEFLIFLYGCYSKDQARKLIRGVKGSLDAATLPLPGEESLKIRASAGVAWYPDDSGSIDMLVKYADFAMYKIKHSVKGGICEFDYSAYNRDAYLLHAKEALNQLIDRQMVEYHFQPIVCARTGEVHAYEALMRPLSDAFKSPMEILTLARAQSQLYSIERLTWMRAPAEYLERQKDPGKYRLFINSISNQVLTPEDLEEMETRFSSLLSLLVIELTEEEKTDEHCAHVKAETLARWGSVFAIDDYGTGYNGEVVMLQLSPKYVKVDHSIVRGIDCDESRQMLLTSLIAFCRQKEILVIAEGVETLDELRAVIACGADLVQGYYTGRPARDPQPVADSVRKQICALALEYYGNCEEVAEPRFQDSGISPELEASQ